MRTPSLKPVVLLGALEPVVQAALIAAAGDEFDIHSSSASGSALASQARAENACAVVVHTQGVPEVDDNLPSDMILFGISVTNYDLIVRKNGRTEHVENPTAEQVMAIARSARVSA